MEPKSEVFKLEEKIERIEEAMEHWASHQDEVTHFTWDWAVPVNALILDILRHDDTDESFISMMMPLLESVAMPAFMAGYYIGGGRILEPIDDDKMYDRVKKYIEERVTSGRTEE